MKISPFAAAVARLESKTPVAARLRSAEWEAMQLGLKERAFWSAQVEDIRTVATMQGKIREALDLSSRDRGQAFMDRSRFIAEMRQHLGAAPGDSTELSDITSSRRLGLIYDFQLQDAREGARWAAAQDPDLLDAFPAQELVREIEPRGGEEAKRPWEDIWLAHGGQFPGRRMIARKDDPIWKAISRFGRPWPPFDYNSGMGLVDIDRAEAEALGIIRPDEQVKRQDIDFNAELQASIPEAAPELLEGFKGIFGDDVAVSAEGKIVWQGERLAELYRRATAVEAPKFTAADVHRLGVATPEAISVGLRDLGIDLTGWRLEVRGSELRHSHQTHGADSMKGGDQVSITEREVRAIPLVWRAPTNLEWSPGRPAKLQGDTPDGWASGKIRMSSSLADGLYLGEYVADPQAKILRLGSMWKKKGGAR